MKCVFVLFDSLNRLMMSPYALGVDTPNFARFARRAVTFDHHYVGSLPCMPARRDLHTGRPSFMHRSWGPLEPFDTSVATELRRRGVYTHLITDHFHYFEEGGAGYHTKFNTWEFMRGQEYDQWKAIVDPPLERYAETYDGRHYDLKKKPTRLQHMVNMDYTPDEEQLSGPMCFKAAFEFLDANAGADDWFLQLELFDPHEPFTVPARYRRGGDSTWRGGILDWPDYERVGETPEEIAEIRASYTALLAMCDAYFGRLLDYFDAHDLWCDTMLMVSTDHGFLLSEHDWWGKCRMPYYEEITHIPLLVWHPDHVGAAGGRRQAVTWTPDLMPTLLDVFGCPVPPDVTARSLLPLLAADRADERVVAFAVFGGPIGVTDGHHVLFHQPPDFTAPGLSEYTLAPQHMRECFTAREMATATLHPGFDFTKHMPVLKIAALPDAKRVPLHDGQSFQDARLVLYDLERDPGQTRPIRDPAVEARLYAGLADMLAGLDVPEETLRWYSLDHLVAVR